MDLAEKIISNHVMCGLNGKYHVIDSDGKQLIRNICNWALKQSMDKEDTISALTCMLKGIDIGRDDIDKYYTEMEEGK